MTKHLGLRKTLCAAAVLVTSGLACKGCGPTTSATKGLIPFAANDWSVEWIERQPEAGEYPEMAGVDIALDQAGCPHVAYGGGRPRHASRCAGSWEIELVNSVARYTGRFSVAVNQEDTEFIAYYASAEDRQAEVRYVMANRQGILKETVVSTGDGTGHPSLALFPSGEPVLVYGREDQLLLAERTDDDWRTEVITDGLFVSSNSIAVDHGGMVWVVFEGRTYEDIVLYAARHDGNRWRFDELYETWGEGVSLETSLALDEEREPHIAFVDTEHWQMIYGARLSGKWHLEEIAGGAEALSRPKSPAIALGPDNRVYICYTASGSQIDDIVLAWSGGDGWQRTTVERSEDLGGCAIEVDGDGGIHLAYSRGNGYQVRYAYHLPLE